LILENDNRNPADIKSAKWDTSDQAFILYLLTMTFLRDVLT